MPSATMLHPLANLLAPNAPMREGLRHDLQRWFWASTFRQTYAQAANTQASADARTLRAWQADAGAVPEVVKSFRFDAGLLTEGRARNEMVVRGILCRSVLNNARDWCEDKRFLDLQDNLEIHHVFPDDFLKQHYKGEKDPVANFAVLTESTNRRLRNQHPKDVLGRPDTSEDAIKSHWIDLDSLKEAAEDAQDPAKGVERFLARRAEELVPMIYAAVGAPQPRAGAEAVD